MDQEEEYIIILFNGLVHFHLNVKSSWNSKKVINTGLKMTSCVKNNSPVTDIILLTQLKPLLSLSSLSSGYNLLMSVRNLSFSKLNLHRDI